MYLFCNHFHHLLLDHGIGKHGLDDVGVVAHVRWQAGCHHLLERCTHTHNGRSSRHPGPSATAGLA